MGLAVRVAVMAAALVAAAFPAAAQAGNAAATPTVTATVAPTASAATTVARPPARLAPTARTTARSGQDRSRCGKGLVALTFDDGPARGTTMKLVGILERRHVPATFFMLGSRVHAMPRLARRVAAHGFTVGNHTWSHRLLTRLPGREVKDELRRTARELRRVGIGTSTLMRPPYGDIDARVRADVRALELVPVLWDVDSGDWRGGSARRIADSVLRQLRPHRRNIVLQHDGVRNSPASVRAVPIVVHEARRRGYCFAELGPRGGVRPPAVGPAAGRRPGSVPARPIGRITSSPAGFGLELGTAQPLHAGSASS